MRQTASRKTYRESTPRSIRGGSHTWPPIPSTATDDTATEDMDHETEETTSEPSQSQPLSYAQVSDPNEELSPSRDLFNTSPPSRKRPPSSPAKTDNSEPKQQRASSSTAIRDPAFKFLYAAAKQAGAERKKLMTTIPGPQYYRCRAWLSPDGSVSSRIDYIGYPYVWVSSVSSCDIVPCPFSDHCAVSLSVSVPDVVPPGPSLCKLNTSVLEEEGYVHLISNFLNGWRCQSHLFPSLVKWWETGKSRIKGLTVHYCCSRSSALSVKRDLLSRLSSHLKDRVANGQLSLVETYQSVLHQLAELDVEVAKGAQVRARARWIEEGVSSSAYFFRLQKKRGADRWISAIRNDDGTIVSAPDDLCLSFSSFCSSLFTASPTDASAQESLLGNVVSSLPADQSDSCEGLLIVDECFAALVGMARRKAPGSDGLPAEFYLKFWAVFGG